MKPKPDFQRYYLLYPCVHHLQCVHRLQFRNIMKVPCVSISKSKWNSEWTYTTKIYDVRLLFLIDDIWWETVHGEDIYIYLRWWKWIRYNAAVYECKEGKDLCQVSWVIKSRVLSLLLGRTCAWVDAFGVVCWLSLGEKLFSCDRWTLLGESRLGRKSGQTNR